MPTTGPRPLTPTCLLIKARIRGLAPTAVGVEYATPNLSTRPQSAQIPQVVTEARRRTDCLRRPIGGKVKWEASHDSGNVDVCFTLLMLS
jgi:hypothetical protein